MAADFLVPTGILTSNLSGADSVYGALEDTARACKVNFAVAARKAKDAGLVGEGDFLAALRRYKGNVPAAGTGGGGGGNYFLNKQYKLGFVFSEAVLTAVHSDYLSYRDAYDLTGLSAPSFKTYFEEAA